MNTIQKTQGPTARGKNQLGKDIEESWRQCQRTLLLHYIILYDFIGKRSLISDRRLEKGEFCQRYCN